MSHVTCWLAPFSTRPCEGRLIRAHLIPRQLLKREGLARFIDDPATWVPGCGGITGCSGHHGQLDSARTLRVPREALPEALEAFCADHGLLWFLDREYGPLEMAA